MEEFVDNEVSFTRAHTAKENELFFSPVQSPVGKRAVQFADATNVSHLGGQTAAKRRTKSAQNDNAPSSCAEAESESFKPADEVFGKGPDAGALDVGFDFLDSIVTGGRSKKDGFVAKRRIRESVFQSFDPLAEKMEEKNEREDQILSLVETQDRNIESDVTSSKAVPVKRQLKMKPATHLQKCDENLMGFTPEKSKPAPRREQEQTSSLPETIYNVKTTSKLSMALMEEVEAAQACGIPKDVSVLDNDAGTSSASSVEHTTSLAKPKVVDILDASPSDIFKFTERDLHEHVEAAVKEARSEADILQAENSALSERLDKETQNSQELLNVLTEFEATVKHMVQEAERTKAAHAAQIDKLTKERDDMVVDLKGVESSFSDLHKRYEKLRSVVDNFRSNEEMLKAALETAKASVVEHENRYTALHKHAEAKILQANQTIEQAKEAAEEELKQLRSKVRQQELKIHTLEQTVVAKDAENRELMKICDELITKIH